MTDHLRVEHLEVHYGDLVGVRDVSLDVQPGTIVALLGSNGAASAPARFPAASGRCWPSAAR